MPDYVICARNVTGKRFGSEPGPSKFLIVPDEALPLPSQGVSRDSWAKHVLVEARKSVPAEEFGHVMVFVHGYNTNQQMVMDRHRRLKADVAAHGFRGTVVSFDWPSGDMGLFYLEDLVDANNSAFQLVADGIKLLAKLQTPECTVNIHILAHSMGAYVTREAFTSADDADDLAGQTWFTSQIILIAGDISSSSLSGNDPRTNGLYRNCARLTCYSNRHDGVLGLSNFKRAGVRPRAGRVGLPDDAPEKAVNVDCSDYYEKHLPREQKVLGTREHSWHIGDAVFTRDLVDTMHGIDRDVMVTRATVGPNRLKLVPVTTPG